MRKIKSEVRCPKPDRALRPLRELRETPFPARRLRAGGEEGQAILEFALIMPLLLMLLMAIVKFGVLFNNYLMLNNGVIVGARTLAVSRSVGNATPNACGLATTALQQASVGLSQPSITVSIAFPAPGTSTCTAMVAGDSAQVSASYPCNMQILFLKPWPSCKLSSQMTVRIE